MNEETFQWEKIKVEVNKMKKLPTYNMPIQIKNNESSTLGFIDSLTDEDKKNYHLDVPIEELSKLPDGSAGCTPDGFLIRTIGMTRKDLPKFKY